MNLLVDMGNTRLKWATWNGLDIISQQPIPNIEISASVLAKLWRTVNSPTHLAISCVSSSQQFNLIISVAKELWPQITILQEKPKASGFGITNAYQVPEKLGVDRWLGMIAGYHKYQKALCIIGCGTAITLDVLDATGKHLGGLICPGLRLMKEALANNTENLGLNEAAYPFGLANLTDAAIYNGALSAACGLIEHTLSKQSAPLEVILTGGDADVIAAQLSKPAVIDPDLVLCGLALTLRKSL